MSMPAEHMTAVPTLADLLQGYADAPEIPVHGIASDSRLLRDGFLFLAVQGMSSHGLDYIEQAKARWRVCDCVGCSRQAPARARSEFRRSQLTTSRASLAKLRIASMAGHPNT